jgi:LPPG:FO 2-phospho-L-lactate transferase
MSRNWNRVVALSGGVGGARLVDGLAAALPAEALTVVVNTGDDFDHWGMHIAPDLDTVMYTLSGLADEKQGWGVAGETFEALAMVERYGAPAWFKLGDRDLATHIVRTEAMRSGRSLSDVTQQLFRALGVAQRVMPMADGLRQTHIATSTMGVLSFQQWLVGQRGAPPVDEVRFDGTATPAPGVIVAIEAAELVVIAPSNPYVSVDPMLTLDGVRESMAGRPTIGVSPIVGGKAVKGPLADMIPRLANRPASASAVASHYGGLLDAFVVAPGDAADVDGPRAFETDIIMHDRADRARLAAEVLGFAEAIA